MLSRITVIFLAFLVASVAAGITISVALLGPEWPALSGDAGERTGFWVLVFFAASASGAVIILPLFLLVVLAESYRLRSVLLYAIAGAAVMLFGYFMSGFAEHADPATVYFPTGHEAAIAAAAGVVFGFVYWLLAGRKAGFWRGRRP
ncbi:MAG: hypothetical protein GEU91_03655 [Rhizobiales bacterium]|nr:hypothetical protein [Hyphomicrobiales bacterium]